MPAMERCAPILMLLVLASCATGPAPDPEREALRDSTLERFDGTPITVEELKAGRSTAITTARMIALAERSMHEPQFEARDARAILEDLRRAQGHDAAIAMDAWQCAEPRAPGARRHLFAEHGVYASALLPFVPGPRMHPREFVDYLAEVRNVHLQFTPDTTILAAWQRFAPLVTDRRDQYIASCWAFELDYPGMRHLLLRDSLLGPFARCAMYASDVSFLGPEDVMDGYTGPRALLELLQPGPTCPLPGLVDDWLARCGNPTDEDGKFLKAALTGMRDGLCSLEQLPAGTVTLQVTYSFLIGAAEARATVRLSRSGNAWVPVVIEYEPAAASITGNGGARLDLLDLLKQAGAVSR